MAGKQAGLWSACFQPTPHHTPLTAHTLSHTRTRGTHQLGHVGDKAQDQHVHARGVHPAQAGRQAGRHEGRRRAPHESAMQRRAMPRKHPPSCRRLTSSAAVPPAARCARRSRLAGSRCRWPAAGAGGINRRAGGWLLHEQHNTQHTNHARPLLISTLYSPHRRSQQSHPRHPVHRLLHGPHALAAAHQQDGGLGEVHAQLPAGWQRCRWLW